MTNEAGNQMSISAETVPLSFLELVERRPKIALRRTAGRALQNSIRSYDLNRRTEAALPSLGYVRLIVGETKPDTPPKVADAPGLTWRKTKVGWEARWRARTDIAKKGYRPSVCRLWVGTDLSPDDSLQIAGKCQSMQREMHEWLQPPLGNQGVYFLDDGEAIKIGFTDNLAGRLSNLRAATARPLTPVAIIAGPRDDEKKFHQKFAHLRLRGEWFRREPELLDFIESVRKRQ